MQTRDDEQFEAYLKRFLPIAPEAMQAPSVIRASWSSFRLRAGLAAITAVLIAIVGTVILHVRGSRLAVTPKVRHIVASAQRHAPLEPLTIGSADAWLATAPSFKAAVDDLAFRSESSPIDRGKQSAVAVLSKEKIRL